MELADTTSASCSPSSLLRLLLTTAPPAATRCQDISLFSVVVVVVTARWFMLQWMTKGPTCLQRYASWR